MLFVDERRQDPPMPSVRDRQPAVYATRLVRAPAVVSARGLEQFRAEHVHAKSPACVRLACERCSDLDAIERMVERVGAVDLHPVHPPFPEGK